MVRLRIVFTVPGMEDVNVRRDLVYKTADDQPLHMDVYSPPGPAQPRPAVVLIHGGPIPRIGAKNMGIFASYGELLAASEMVALTFNHRFLAQGRVVDAGNDVADLLAHVRLDANSLGIDPERLAVWAFSGGGPLLAAPLRDRPAWLHAVVAYYAVMDLQQEPPGQAAPISADVRRTFSPLDAVAQGAGRVPPVLVARGGLDHPWLNGTIDRFVQAALHAGVAVELLNHPEGRHGFDILNDDPRSKEIIRRTLDFLREHLLSPYQGKGSGQAGNK
jgi:acetyl esterase/lipase